MVINCAVYYGKTNIDVFVGDQYADYFAVNIIAMSYVDSDKRLRIASQL